MQAAYAVAATDGLLLALDLGTTTVRAVLFDPRGGVVAESACEQPIYHPQPDWAEIDSDERWAAAVVMIRACLGQMSGAAARVRAIGLTGLMHALTPLDEDGHCLDRAMAWMDQRCRPQAEWLAREHGALLERVLGRTSLGTTPSAPKLRWVAEHRPALVARARHWLLMKDLAAYRLCGAMATDPSDAGGTGLYDRRTGDWSDEMLALVGVRRETLPRIRLAGTLLGGVTPEAASATGLAAGTPVILGAGDVASTLLGARTGGAENAPPQRGCLYLGTAAWAALPKGDGLVFGSTATTGAALTWALRLTGQGDPCGAPAAYARALSDAAGVPPGANGLIFLPHLMGERGPHADPRAKGALFGLTLAHGPAEIVRAVLEGCALQLRATFDAVGWQREGDLVTVGGGAKSALWLQIIADATGAELLVPPVLEAGALGAAIQASVGVGLFPDVRAASDHLVRAGAPVRPDPARAALYDQVYAIYRELEERVAPLYARLPVEREISPLRSQDRQT
ncbi:MAG: FGGY family carbohydrate kinase [Chloroflexota bacterium]